jgi:DNA-binding HxlR family transcriptional regulator
MLIRHLKELVADGVLERVSDDGERQVRYGFSEYGRTMLPALEAICEWGRENLRVLSEAAGRD